MRRTWLGFFLFVALLSPALGQRGTTTRVSVSSSGQQVNGGSSFYEGISISADGRYVAFSSYASSLVPGDTNNVEDVFVHDRHTGQTSRVSVSSSGQQGNSVSYYPSISADGRYVAFNSYASNLVPGDTNGAGDVFLHDGQTGQTSRVSVSSSGQQGNSYSYHPSISADGRYVAFSSYASSLVPGDTNNVEDVFVHDRHTGQTSRVSVSSSGEQGNSSSGSWNAVSISADGRYVAFASYASNLVPGDTNGAGDVFLHDGQTGQTSRVSVSSSGQQGDSLSGYYDGLSISADGRYVAFASYASNLVPGDTNNVEDVFVHDRQTGQTSRVSVSSSGQQGNSYSYYPSISADGRYVAFNSNASNLVPGDTNGAGDVFLHDGQTGQTSRVSVSSSGQQGNSESYYPSISADGRYGAFKSFASNLVSGDTNNVEDIFVHQYGSGEGWNSPPPYSGGNTSGDQVLRDRAWPATAVRPVILVHGITVSFNLFDWPVVFIGGPADPGQWNDFAANWVTQYGAEGYSVYNPVTNPNGNVFVCSTLDTRLSVDRNADLLNDYVASIAGAPAFWSANDFDVVGYSMGGLIARRWEQKYDRGISESQRSFNVLRRQMRNLVTFSTPHAGSFIADQVAAWSLPGMPAPVLDMTTSGTRTFNNVNIGIPGTRYSLIAAQMSGYLYSILGGGRSDGVVLTSSQRNSSWVYPGFAGSQTTLDGLGHVAGIGRDVRDAPETASAVHDMIFGWQFGQGDPPDNSHPSLNKTIVILPGQTKNEMVQLAKNVPEAGFSITCPAGPLSLTLIEPGGRVIDPNVAALDPKIEFVSDGLVQGYKVLLPLGGTWTMRCQALNGFPVGGAVVAIGAYDTTPFDISISSGSEVVHRGGTGSFSLFTAFSGDVKVEGTLIRPDGSQAAIKFVSLGNAFMVAGQIPTPMPGTYRVVGHFSGFVDFRGGRVQRYFTASFDASPETARLGGIAAYRPTDDPNDLDSYYDLLNIDINVQVNEPGTYTLSGNLKDQFSVVIDSTSTTFTAVEAGPRTVTLSFIGEVIGDHDRNGPYHVQDVRLTDETNVAVLTDYQGWPGTTPPYSKLSFETIHPRTVAPPGWLRKGMNLVSFPLDGIELHDQPPYVLGPNAHIQYDPAMPWIERGKAYWVEYTADPPKPVSYLGTQEYNEYGIYLDVAGDHLVGCPYNRPLPLSRTLVENGLGQVRTAEQDAANPSPWVIWTWMYYDSGGWQKCGLNGEETALRPWYGYKVTTNVPGLYLTLRD